jgi:hypothetical protein
MRVMKVRNCNEDEEQWGMGKDHAVRKSKDDRGGHERLERP